MNLAVRPTSRLKGALSVPPSKSYTHRAIILASLAKGTTTIHNPLLSDDTLASIEACRMIGAKIRAEENILHIDGVGGDPKASEKEIDVKNSGTTLRIMTPVASLCDKKVTLTGDDSIRKRPMQPLLDALEQLGVRTTSENGKPPVTVTGPMKGGRCRIRGDVSSQFISGLLIALPLSPEDTDIELTSDLRSRPYVEMTLDLMERFNVQVEKSVGFRVTGNQIYNSIDYEVEGDYSSAAIIFAGAAIMQSEVRVENLPKDSRQGDRRIVDILREMGTNVQAEEDSVTIIGGGKLDGIEIDLSDNPDLVPPVAVMGCFAKGKTLIKNVEHLRYKECDRLKALATELKKMHAKIREGKDFLEIQGVDNLKGAHVSGWKDHRIVMSLAIAGLRAKGETIIEGAESIPVSFPDFVEAMKGLGANYELV